MSVKVHEPVCEDSAQDLYFWFDHFLGDQLKDEWRSTGPAGSAAVVDAQTGGIVRITTGAVDGNNWRIDWNNIRSLLVSKKVTMESRVKLDATANRLTTVELSNDGGNNRIYFRYDTATSANWYIYSNAGASTSADSGIAADTDYHIFRIECFPTGQIHFYIDGVETANSPLTTNITALYLEPRFYNHTRENVAKIMDIDYVVIRQER